MDNTPGNATAALSPSAPPLSDDRIIADRYRITGELGRGGMGIVYRAQDTKLNREVALKVLPSAALATDDDRARFYREAQAAAALHHPNIATIFEIDEAVPSDAPHGTQPSPFILMEDVVIHPDHRGLGYGAKLVDHVVEFAKQKNFKRITLLTDKMSADSQEFFKKHGFEYSHMVPMRRIID